MVIFDCNGVLVDGEPIAAAVAAEEFTRAGFAMTAEVVAHFFMGRRAIDMFADVEAATRRKLPANFPAVLAAATLRRIRDELRPMPHAAYALTWLREPKCVASSTTLERIRVSLETTGLVRYFEPNLFSANDVARGKPAPDLFIGFAGGSHVQAHLPAKLSAAGARAVIADMRVLKSTIVALRGW